MSQDRSGPVGIVDIGSNSVRFVVYGGNPRVPEVLFNEKVMAALGKGLDADGLLSAGAMERALAALGRFGALARASKLTRVHTVATAAVRDASNGSAFMKDVAELGFEPMVLAGTKEAELAGLGVVSGIPDADGVAGDLGGGSLELIEVEGGGTGRGVSLPLGVLRVSPTTLGAGALSDMIVEALAGTGIADQGRSRPFYLVGGSWRALGLIDLYLSNHPLPMIHQHVMTRGRVTELRETILGADLAAFRTVPSLSNARIPTLPAAVTLLEALMRTLEPSQLVISAYGLREGLLYDYLTLKERSADPLLVAARELGARYGRYDDHGDLIDGWIAGIFEDDTPPMARLRLTACLLADIAWGAHPDFRAERAVDMAVHGNWVGIDAAGRAMLGLTLFSAFGGQGVFDPRVAGLCDPAQCARAQQWGLAIRLAQRLSGGVAEPLRETRLTRAAGALTISMPRETAALGGEAVSRRLRSLAGVMGLEAA